MKHRLVRMLWSFARETRGSIAIGVGLTVPLFAGAAFVALDYLDAQNAHAELQRAADTAALSAARELRFVAGSGNKQDDDDDDDDKRKRSPDTVLTAIAASSAQHSLGATESTLSTNAFLVTDEQVKVELAFDVDTILAQITGVGKRRLTVSAVAEVFGGQNICIVSVETGKLNPGIELEDSARIKGDGCGVYSNSTEKHSIRAKDSAFLDANFICAAGGYEGADANFATAVTTDCPQIADPLDSRVPPPSPTTCDHNNLVIDSTSSVNLEPGAYCGGLTIKDDADVWMNPGIYIIQGDKLVVEHSARLRGENVSLLFDDDKAEFDFKGEAEIELSAPETGPLAGILVYARKLCPTTACTSPRLFKITSANVRSLLGTLYLPQDDLEIDTTMPVSEEAAFTIIVVDNLKLKQSPVLVLNTDYAATDVPAPADFVGGTRIRLLE